MNDRYRLHIDDLRTPSDEDMEFNQYVIVRSSAEAIEYIYDYGLPTFISFDHDLGGEDTAMIVVDFIINEVLNEALVMPEHFEFKVHSANPVGAENIETKLNNFIRFLHNQ